jgi:glycine/D-amino acid oxidase-like deaminating enzyme/nitrite reductase/ring-hydroxylating ferredoxin subunit
MHPQHRDSTSGAKVSIWTRSAEAPKFPVAPDGLAPDVCVIGAGITGLSVAYTLAEQGTTVVVIDDGAVGSGETGRSSAHLASAVDDHFSEIESMLGPEAARVVAQSHSDAISRIEAVAAAEGIECGFERVPGYLFSNAGGEAGFLDRELAAARRAGLSARKTTRAPIPMFETGPALEFDGQAQFHPLAYLAGLAAAVERLGGRIYTAHAAEIRGGADARVALRSGHVIRPKAIVVATNVPVNDRFTMHTKLMPQRTYVIAAHVPEGLPKALLWDTADPYHYVRLAAGADNAPGQQLLVVGGEDHPVGQAEDFDARYERLEGWMRSRWPEAGVVHARWSGQIVETLDGLAYIGRNPGDHDNVFIATGDSGNGLTHGTIAGLILPELIRGRPHPWAATYDPARKSLKTAGEFGRHNLKVAARMAGDWIKGHAVKEEEDIPIGSGAVIRKGLKHIAVFRDEHGEPHRMSAVCPHMKCIVTWNASERTWDCPCHGSRFDCRGHVLNGPSIADLEHLTPSEHPAGSIPTGKD